jgi:hypothetical protein
LELSNKRSGSDFAPSLPRFLAYCVPPIVEDAKKQERETYQRLSLPKKRASAETRQAAMVQIWTELKIVATPTASKEALEQRQAAMIQAAEIINEIRGGNRMSRYFNLQLKEQHRPIVIIADSHDDAETPPRVWGRHCDYCRFT